MKKLVIYTCVTGGYDTIEDPAAICPDADYIAFTTGSLESGVWQRRDLTYPRAGISEAGNTAPTLAARWHKLHPATLFPEYEYSLWIDGNVVINGPQIYQRLEKLMSSGVKYAGIPHPFGGDAYDEAARILHADKESFRALSRTVRFLRKHDFPRGMPLYETNVLLRKHSDPQVRRCDEMWWTCLSTLTKRDQMTQSYCLRECGITPKRLLPEGRSARDDESFKYILHGRQWVKDLSPKGRLRDALRRVKELTFKTFVLR